MSLNTCIAYQWPWSFVKGWKTQVSHGSLFYNARPMFRPKQRHLDVANWKKNLSVETVHKSQNHGRISTPDMPFGTPMKAPFPTTDFLVTHTAGVLELWIDWVPAVDGDPEQPLSARLEGDVLVLEPIGDNTEERSVRHVEGLDEKVLQDLKQGLVLYISGPSGVLGEHRLTVAIPQVA